jgi:hypothetical protein
LRAHRRRAAEHLGGEELQTAQSAANEHLGADRFETALAAGRELSLDAVMDDLERR